MTITFTPPIASNLFVVICLVAALSACGGSPGGTSPATSSSIAFSSLSSSQEPEKKLTLQGGAMQGASLQLKNSVTTFAGRISPDGAGNLARLYEPGGMVSDGTFLFALDSGNKSIRKVLIATGEVSTLSGGVLNSQGLPNFTNFGELSAITSDGINLYVTDTYCRCIFKVDKATGQTETFLGGYGSLYVDDYFMPSGVVSDGAYLYVTDSGNANIRKINIATKEVSTLAGGNSVDPATLNALSVFGSPSGITLVGEYLYVTDVWSHNLHKVSRATGEVSNFAGYSRGFADGMGKDASFNGPKGITTDGAYLYVADTNNYIVRKVLVATAEVTTLANTATLPPEAIKDLNWDDSIMLDTPLKHLEQAVTSDGINVYISENDNYVIRKHVIATGKTSVLAGHPHNTDAVGAAASFATPTDVTTDGSNLYVVDSENNSIRKIEIATANVTTLAGGSYGSADGIGTAAHFKAPHSITTDGASLYVLDANGLRKIAISTGLVTTLALRDKACDELVAIPPNGTQDAPTNMLFCAVGDITTDGTNLYFLESKGVAKMVIATQEMSLLTANSSGWLMTSDGKNIYVSEGLGNVEKIVLATGEVSTLVHSDGGITDSLSAINGMTTDGVNLYVTNTGWNGYTSVCKIVIATGEITTLSGGVWGNVDGSGSVAKFNSPNGITTDGHSLFVTDSGNNTIRKID